MRLSQAMQRTRWRTAFTLECATLELENGMEDKDR